jgi:peptidoglycan hydrolase-like protein with peptidoglycan-binding domain
LELIVSVRPVAIVTAARCLAVLLLVSGPAAMSAHAQSGWLPWNKEKEKGEKAKDPAAKPKAAQKQPKEAAPAGTVDEQADLAFWNSVKDRGKPDELRAYLKQFPEGRFAELARLRLKDAENAQTETAGAEASASVVLREVQDRLYKLNYPITRFDGGLDDGTDRAIKAWQVKHDFAPSGVLTAEQLKVLRAMAPATIWGAIAHPVVGTATTVFGKASRQEAESQALTDCKAKNGVACKVQAAAASDCVAVASYRGKGADGRDYVTHFYARQPNVAVAAAKAVLTCTAHPLRGANRCTAVGAACGSSAATAEQLNKALSVDPAGKQPLPQPKSKGQQDT